MGSTHRAVANEPLSYQLHVAPSPTPFNPPPQNLVLHPSLINQTIQHPISPAAQQALQKTFTLIVHSQQLVEKTAAVIDIGLHQRPLTPAPYYSQQGLLLSHIEQQQRQSGALTKALPPIPKGLHPKASQAWQKSLSSTRALLLLHQAALAALHDHVANQPANATASDIAKELPILEKNVVNFWQSTLVSFSNIAPSREWPPSLESPRCHYVLTTSLPPPVGSKPSTHKDSPPDQSLPTTTPNTLPNPL
ncbi:MAG: hypothetical protein U0003_03755 [Vampirovibrionales bacterium]